LEELKMKETKVYQIETKVYSGDISRSTETRALYEACEKVFEIPEWELVQEAIAGDVTPLQTWAQEIRAWYESSSTPFDGPAVFTDLAGGEVLTITNGRREVYVTPESVTVNFVRDGEGSTIAAGEVIGHLWAGDPGDSLEGIFITLDDGTTVEHKDYDGPVHPQLGRICYDADFKARFEAGQETWLQEVVAK
jgi:hypothetical protein